MNTLVGPCLEDLREKMSEIFEKIAQFCRCNRLKMNADKTDFMYWTSPQKAVHLDMGAEVSFGSEVKKPSNVARVLGFQTS